MIDIKPLIQVVEEIAQNSKDYQRVSSMSKDDLVEKLALAGEAIADLLILVPERMEDEERAVYRHFINMSGAMREYQNVNKALDTVRAA